MVLLTIRGYSAKNKRSSFAKNIKALFEMKSAFLYSQLYLKTRLVLMYQFGKSYNRAVVSDKLLIEMPLISSVIA